MKRDLAGAAGEVEPVVTGRRCRALDECQAHVADQVGDVLDAELQIMA